MRQTSFTAVAAVGRKTFAVRLSLVAAVSCSSDAQTGKALEEEAKTLQRLTLPAGATNFISSGLERSHSIATISWEFESSGAWEKYRRYVSDRLGREAQFKGPTEKGASLEFVKELPADTHAVQIEVVHSTPPLRIRVTFRAWAS